MTLTAIKVSQFSVSESSFWNFADKGSAKEMSQERKLKGTFMTGLLNFWEIYCLILSFSFLISGPKMSRDLERRRMFFVTPCVSQKWGKWRVIFKCVSLVSISGIIRPPFLSDFLFFRSHVPLILLFLQTFLLRFLLLAKSKPHEKIT